MIRRPIPGPGISTVAMWASEVPISMLSGVLPDGSVLVSFNSGSFSLPGTDRRGLPGTTVEDSDLVLFTPSSTGSSSAGTWSFYLDGLGTVHSRPTVRTSMECATSMMARY